jgi:hypothetical protein
METLKGNFTQVDYNKLMAELRYLEMRIYLGEDNEENRKRVKEIKEILNN